MAKPIQEMSTWEASAQPARDVDEQDEESWEPTRQTGAATQLMRDKDDYMDLADARNNDDSTALLQETNPFMMALRKWLPDDEVRTAIYNCIYIPCNIHVYMRARTSYRHTWGTGQSTCASGLDKGPISKRHS